MNSETMNETMRQAMELAKSRPADSGLTRFADDTHDEA